MKKIFTLLLFMLCFTVFSQEMTNEKLGEIITKSADSVQGELGRWQFKIQSTIFIVITDVNNNRMRIISPIADTVSLEKEMLENALIANFHSALDVKYAISDGVLWSAYIHPLKELTEQQAKDAISQVYYANVNFGTTYASTSLIFPGRTQEESEEKPEKKKIKTRKT